MKLVGLMGALVYSEELPDGGMKSLSDQTVDQCDLWLCCFAVSEIILYAFYVGFQSL
jgi:hypothetical protein